MQAERDDRFWKTASALSLKRKAEWAWFQTAECGRKKTIISVDCYEAQVIVWAMEEYLWKHSEYYPERDLGIRKCAEIEWEKGCADGQNDITLNSPLTGEQWDAITDVDFDNTNEIYFHTKHGKEVYFVKRKKGKWKHGCCSECGYNWGKDAPISNVTNYCPNCGSYNGKETEDERRKQQGLL